jgi:hypothetical protein
MNWFLWLYLVVGEVVALLAISDEEGADHVHWLSRRTPWWGPYAGTAVFVMTWPIAAVVLVLLGISFGRPTR